ncbi:cell division protein FtsA, partial [Candidatus Woesebacteria bacterium]|nr:cell division protein FtsA [Candidatus Woesebacteria bacterium]
MPHNKIITGIDVGTDKCVTLIASVNNEGSLQVVGVSVVPSRGMRKSQIIDLEKVLETITESLDGAERMAGLEVKSAYVSVSGAHVKSQNSTGVVAVATPNQEITNNDVERVIEAARAISLSSDREIIHVIPKDYKVDSQDGIKDPVGMTGVRLESEAHIITGMSTALRNLEKCIEDLGITVNEFVFSGISAAGVVLSETEKELGVALVDIGAGSTSICAYVEGSLEYSGSIPIGARHITQDIALGCRVSLDTAEKIKVDLSNEKMKTLTPHAGESKADFS